MSVSQSSSLMVLDERSTRRPAARTCAGLRSAGGSSQDAEVAAAVAVAMAPVCALGAAASAPSLGHAEQFGVDDAPSSNGLAAVANPASGSASALSSRSDTEGTAFDSPWGAESASILRQCRLLSTPFQPPARTRPRSEDESSAQAGPARPSGTADSCESGQSVAFPRAVALPSMSVESASGISVGGRLPIPRGMAGLGAARPLQRGRDMDSFIGSEATGGALRGLVGPSAAVEVLNIPQPAGKRARLAPQVALAPPLLAPAGTLATGPATAVSGVAAAASSESRLRASATTAMGAAAVRAGRRAPRHSAASSSTSRKTPPRRPARAQRAATAATGGLDASDDSSRLACPASAAAQPGAAPATTGPWSHPLWRSPVRWAWSDDRTYVKTDIEVIAQATTHAAKLAAAAHFFGIGTDAGPRTTVLTKAKDGASLTFSAFWPASPAECDALLDATVAASERVEGCRKRVCRVCDPASPRTNFRRHLEQHLGVSYMCNAVGCGRVFRGSHVNLLQHVDKCRGRME